MCSSKSTCRTQEQLIQIKDIVVRIDPNKPKKYLMDTSFLPEISA